MLEKLVSPLVVQASKPKFMISGESGVGKTFFALDFKKPILLDCEGGATRSQYQQKLKDSGGMYFGKEQGSQSFIEVIKLVKELTTQKHEFKTLIIDSFSYLYMLESAEAELKGGSDFGRDKKMANIPTRQLMSALEKLDLTVILIAHSKDKWERKTGGNGKEQIVNVGTTFDGWEKLEYTLDLWIEIVKGGKTFNVKKSRISSLPQGDSFPLSYDRFAELYGKEVLEKEAIPVELASAEDIARLASLIEGLKVDQDTQDKWFKKCNVESYLEMSKIQIQSLIQFCEKQVMALTMGGKQ